MSNVDHPHRSNSCRVARKTQPHNTLADEWIRGNHLVCCDPKGIAITIGFRNVEHIFLLSRDGFRDSKIERSLVAEIECGRLYH